MKKVVLPSTGSLSIIIHKRLGFVFYICSYVNMFYFSLSLSIQKSPLVSKDLFVLLEKVFPWKYL